MDCQSVQYIWICLEIHLNRWESFLAELGSSTLGSTRYFGLWEKVLSGCEISSTGSYTLLGAAPHLSYIVQFDINIHQFHQAGSVRLGTS